MPRGFFAFGVLPESMDVGPHFVGQSSGGQPDDGEAIGHRQMFLDALSHARGRAARTGSLL